MFQHSAIALTTTRKTTDRPATAPQAQEARPATRLAVGKYSFAEKRDRRSAYETTLRGREVTLSFDAPAFIAASI
jgi:hypothetical protein